MIVELFDSYGYDTKGGNFICNAIRRGLKYEPETRVSRKRNALCTFFMESGQETNDINQSPLLYERNEKEEGKHDYSNDYLTFTALEDGTISFIISYEINTDRLTSISYSVDNGTTWTTIDNEDDKEDNIQIDVDVNEGDKVLWKGNALALALSDENDNVSSFVSDIEVNVEGNIMSLLYGDDFTDKIALPDIGYNFYEVFAKDINSGINVVNAKNLILPATTLTESCYDSMFYGCTSLVTAPELPATTLAEGCYYSMFDGCTSLTTVPTILPATTLVYGCYMGMFRDCSSLTTAPELPATTLASRCYMEMFRGCTSLNYIKCLATNISASNSHSSWVLTVASTGIFVKDKNMTSWTIGNSGIPSGWSIENA